MGVQHFPRLGGVETNIELFMILGSLTDEEAVLCPETSPLGL